MTLIESWGCGMIVFGPTIAMFVLTVAHDPIKIIVLITSSFFWFLSFLIPALFWWVLVKYYDTLLWPVTLAVLSQESFRYLFHRAAMRAQSYLTKVLTTDFDDSKTTDRSIRSSEIQLSQTDANEIQCKISVSYVAGLGFGWISAAFAMTNALMDYSGPGTVGIRGDSGWFLLVSSLTALAFTLLNVSWSVLMSESIEKSDLRYAAFVLATHLIASYTTFINQQPSHLISQQHLQLISLTIVYSLAILCGLGAFQVSDLSPRRLVSIRRSRTNL